jgi:hypothetical protein
VKKLHELAGGGEIMLEWAELEKSLVAVKKVMSGTEFAQAVQEGEEKELLLVRSDNLGVNRSKNFVSLKLKVASLESVSWILKSLEKDEMTPVERAVQSRFKESFGMKMNSAEWAKIG